MVLIFIITENPQTFYKTVDIRPDATNVILEDVSILVNGGGNALNVGVIASTEPSLLTVRHSSIESNGTSSTVLIKGQSEMRIEDTNITSPSIALNVRDGSLVSVRHSHIDHLTPGGGTGYMVKVTENSRVRIHQNSLLSPKWRPLS